MINEEINKKAWIEVQKYMNLDIYGKKVRCPYSINWVEQEFLQMMRDVGVDDKDIEKVHKAYKDNGCKYGWYRGKGTSSEIEYATKELSKLRGIDLKDASEEGIYEFMRQVGIGVDCSGYVFNILRGVFPNDDFLHSLNWLSEKMEASRAGVDIFANNASILVDINDLQSLDLVLFKSKDSCNYSHIALLVEHNGELYITQSSMFALPSGVRFGRFIINNGNIDWSFEFSVGTTIKDFYSSDRIEFRRLTYLV
jgi:hypothetical protein